MKDMNFRSRRNPLFRSLSLDVLDTASNGNIVTENWLRCNGRALQLMCLHDPSTGLAKSRYNLSRQKVPMFTMDDPGQMKCKNYIPWRDTDISYMLVHSNPKLQRPTDDKPEFANEWDINCEKIVIPSLKIQMRMIDTKSCKFTSSEIDDKWDLDIALNHCGFCSFCKPAPDGDGGGVHPSL